MIIFTLYKKLIEPVAPDKTCVVGSWDKFCLRTLDFLGKMYGTTKLAVSALRVNRARPVATFSNHEQVDPPPSISQDMYVRGSVRHS